MISDVQTIRLEDAFKYQARNYLHVACIALVLFDHLHTLNLEVQFIWPSGLSMVTTLYYITRYSLFFDSLITAFRQFTYDMNPVHCRISMWVLVYEYVICVWMGEAVIGMKVWAIWGKDRRLAVVMPILFFFSCVSGLVGLTRFMESIHFFHSPYPQIVSCPISSANNDISWSMVCVTVWAFLMFALLMVPAIREYRSGGSSKFVKMVYQAGIMYYFYHFILALVSVILEFRGPPLIFVGLIAFPARFLQVAFISRILLHTRRQASKKVVILNESSDGGIRWTHSSFTSD